MTTAPQLGNVQEAKPGFAVRHYSPAEIAELWSLSVDTVRRMFENEPGVLVFENPVRSSSRRFRTLRIPASVAERVYSNFCNAEKLRSRIRP